MSNKPSQTINFSFISNCLICDCPEELMVLPQLLWMPHMAAIGEGLNR